MGVVELCNPSVVKLGLAGRSIFLVYCSIRGIGAGQGVLPPKYVIELFGTDICSPMNSSVN
jgi:hypothetical protein